MAIFKMFDDTGFLTIGNVIDKRCSFHNGECCR